MVFRRLALGIPKVFNLKFDRFKVRGIVKYFQSDNGNGEDSKTPESRPGDQTNNKSILKKVIEDLSRPSKPENPSFFGCRRYMDLAGKVAVITGGSKGVGLAVTKDLIQNEASRMIISGRDVQEGEKAIKILTDMCSDNDDGYQKAIYVPTDVASEEGLKGSASVAVKTLENMIDSGMNVGRLNFSHGTYKYQANTIKNLRQAAENDGKKIGVYSPLAIALDTKGPEVKIGLLEDIC